MLDFSFCGVDAGPSTYDKVEKERNFSPFVEIIICKTLKSSKDKKKTRIKTNSEYSFPNFCLQFSNNFLYAAEVVFESLLKELKKKNLM